MEEPKPCACTVGLWTAFCPQIRLDTLESVIREGENPVQEVEEDEQYPKYCQTRGTWQEYGGTTP